MRIRTVSVGIDEDKIQSLIPKDFLLVIVYHIIAIVANLQSLTSIERYVHIGNLGILSLTAYCTIV